MNLPPSSWFIALFQFIVPFTPTSSKLSLSYRFTHQNPICVSVSPHTFQMPTNFIIHVITRKICKLNTLFCYKDWKRVSVSSSDAFNNELKG